MALALFGSWIMPGMGALSKLGYAIVFAFAAARRGETLAPHTRVRDDAEQDDHRPAERRWRSAARRSGWSR